MLTTMRTHTQTQMLTHHEAIINGIRLHWVEAGQGPLLVLLHGFPEFWYGWRHQIPVLADAGFRVVAPDLRGYGRSERPRGWRAYRVELAAEDVSALIRHVATASGVEDRAVVAGHDWGGVIAASLASRHPERVARIAMLNAPHPGALVRELRRSPSQWGRSAYVLLFQLPALPEMLFRARDFRVLRALLRRGPLRYGAFTPDDIERYVEAFRPRGALTAAINYYRAAVRGAPHAAPRLARRRIEVPSLVIWGVRDRYLVPRLAEGLTRWMPQVRVERIPEASHWVQHDAPERVNELLAAFAAEAFPRRAR